MASRRTRRRRGHGALAALCLLAGCAASEGPQRAGAAAEAVAAQWQTPRPDADPGVQLRRWWQQFDDARLTRLIDAAQAASPTLADAGARLAQARAARVAGGAALGPTLDAGASASRGRSDFVTPVGTSLGASLQAGWEIDLFGAGRAGRDAAQARLEGAQAQWHVARISVAAETASAYLSLRACEAQLVQTELDAASRAETSRLTGLAARAGFQAPASAELARASAAQANAALVQQRAACDLAVKSLVALTALPEPELRAQLQAGRAELPKPARLGVDSVPAQVLAQRPDVAAAEHELVAAAADAAQARAQRYPRVTLAGSIGPARFEGGGTTVRETMWSIGPVSVSVPIFDGGVRRANAQAAQAAYDAAALRYAASLRTAVREVEEALVALQSTASRGEDAQVAADGYEKSFRAVESRYRGGLASLFELEDARRSAVAARSALIELQRERVAAWISLYRALGGGWSAADSTSPQS